MTITESATNVNMKKRKHQDVESDDGSSDDELQTLHIVVRRVGKAESESLKVQLDSDASVMDLKKKIAEELEAQDESVVPIERQRLIFSGKMLRDDNQSLEGDLNMKAGEDQKHFVHLTPLPKGAAPSVRTERELSDNPLSPREETLQRVRARQRRRRRQESQRGMSDPAAYHPYALDLASGTLLPASSSAASAAAAPLALAVNPAEEALLSVAAAAEQSRLVDEVARRTLPAGTTLQTMLLAQQGASAAPTVASLAGTAAANALCPLGQADVATSLLESTLLGGRPAPTNSAVSMLRLANLQSPAAAAALPTETDPTVAALQDILGLARPAPTQETNPTVAALQELLGGGAAARAPPAAITTDPTVAALHGLLGGGAPAAAARLQPTTDPTVAALQELLGGARPPAVALPLATTPTINSSHNEALTQALESLAANAGDLASTLRLLSPGQATSLPLVSSPPPAAAATVTAANTPQDLATRLALEALASPAAGTGSILPGSLAGFL